MIQFDNCVLRFGKLILNELKEANINCWIAGGSLRDYFAGINKPTDYDIFFPDPIEFEKCKSFFLIKKAVIIWESENGMKVVYNNRKFDLVKKFFPDPQATINEFDFTVSMFAVDNNKVYYGETSFIDLAKRQLMINKITYPASTLSRGFRYYKKGFLMCQDEMKKIVLAIQGMPKQEENDITPNENQPPSNINDPFFWGFD